MNWLQNQCHYLHINFSKFAEHSLLKTWDTRFLLDEHLMRFELFACLDPYQRCKILWANKIPLSDRGILLIRNVEWFLMCRKRKYLLICSHVAVSSTLQVYNFLLEMYIVFWTCLIHIWHSHMPYHSENHTGIWGVGENLFNIMFIISP